MTTSATWPGPNANWRREKAQEKGNEAFFVITIAKPVWDRLDEAHRIALVDHELMHCGTDWGDDGKIRLTLIPHDFEGFNAEISRHGLWRPDATRMANAMQNAQLSLMWDEPGSGETAAASSSLDHLTPSESTFGDYAVKDDEGDDTGVINVTVTPGQIPSTKPKNKKPRSQRPAATKPGANKPGARKPREKAAAHA